MYIYTYIHENIYIPNYINICNVKYIYRYRPEVGSAAPPPDTHSSAPRCNLRWKDFQLKTLWYWSSLHSMIFTSDIDKIVQVPSLPESFRLKVIAYEICPSAFTLRFSSAFDAQGAVAEGAEQGWDHSRGPSSRERESSLLTIYWFKSTLSSRWFGRPFSRHESLNSFFQVVLYLPS